MTRTLTSPRLPVKVLSALFLLAVALFSVPTAHATGSTTLVISQVYGGGGNSGALIPNDYVELLNLSSSAINLSGFSLQYGGTAGSVTSSQVHVLSGTIQPGKYFLVEESEGLNINNLTFPVTPDISNGPLTIGSTAGIVLLVNGTAQLTTTGAALCSNAAVVDAVGWSTGVCGEGTVAAVTTNLNYLQRNGAGCTDTNNNATDFTVTTLTTSSMHNSASAAANCTVLPTITNPTATPSTVKFGSNVLLTVTITPGSNPVRTGIAVKANLSTIGGSTTQALNDSGTNGDVTAGDGIYSFSYLVPGATPVNSYTIPVTLTDTQGDTTVVPANIALSVASHTNSSVVLTATPTAPAPNVSTTLTATISPSGATGTVVFNNFGVAINGTGTNPVAVSGGVATTTISGGFPAGGQSLTAVYSGDSNFATSTGSLNIGIIAPVTPDFSLALSNAQVIGSSATPSVNVGVNINAVGGFSSAITLACSGLPSNVSCSFAPRTLTPNAGSNGSFVSSVLTFTTSSSANIKPHFNGKTGGLALAFTLFVAPFAFRKRKSAMRLMMLLAVLLVGMQVLTGCGNGVTAGTSTVTITATAASGQVHTGTITVTTE